VVPRVGGVLPREPQGGVKRRRLPGAGEALYARNPGPRTLGGLKNNGTHPSRAYEGGYEASVAARGCRFLRSVELVVLPHLVGRVQHGGDEPSRDPTG
jgi:hypothetical protein